MVNPRGMRAAFIKATAVLGAALLTFVVSVGDAVPDIGGGLVDIANFADRAALIAKASVEGRKGREEALKNFPVVVPPSSPAVSDAMAVLAEVDAGRKALLAHADQGTNFAGLVREDLQDAPLDITLVSVTGVYAKTFPDNSMLLSRNLVEQPASTDPVRDRWIERFVLAHELVHARDGHAVMNWIALDGKKGANASVAVGAGFNILSAVIEGRYGTDLGNYAFGTRASTYNVLANERGFFEFLSDYWAFYILKQMKAPPGVALDALKFVGEKQGVGATRETGVALGFLPERIDCMARLDTAAAQEETLTDGAEYKGDDQYWACASRSAGGASSAYRSQFMDYLDARREREEERSNSLMLPSPFADETEWQNHQLYLRRQIGVMRVGGDFDSLVIDGIPLTQAGDAYRAPLALPDLQVTSALVSTTKTAFSGEEVGIITVRVANRGRRSVRRPFSIAIAPRNSLDVCPAGADMAVHVCRGVTSPRGLAVGEALSMRLYLGRDVAARLAPMAAAGIRVVGCAEGDTDCDPRESDANNNWTPLSGAPR